MARKACQQPGCSKPVEYANGNCRDCEERKLSKAFRNHGPRGRESRSRLYGAKEDEYETRYGIDDGVEPPVL